jgi:hypothetical protein
MSAWARFVDNIAVEFWHQDPEGFFDKENFIWKEIPEKYAMFVGSSSLKLNSSGEVVVNLNEIRQRKKWEVSLSRSAKEINPILLSTGDYLPGDRVSRSAFYQIRSQITSGAISDTEWKLQDGSWVTINAALSDEVDQKFGNQVRKAFVMEKALFQAIDNINDEVALLAYNSFQEVESYWASN